jgi:hypothetical protein
MLTPNFKQQFNPDGSPSPEGVQQSINAAFDSVNLINGILSGTYELNQSEEDKKSSVNRNVKHLEIMLGKDWFVSGSTSEQLSQINESISSGSAYFAATTGSI